MPETGGELVHLRDTTCNHSLIAIKGGNEVGLQTA